VQHTRLTATLKLHASDHLKLSVGVPKAQGDSEAWFLDLHVPQKHFSFRHCEAESLLVLDYVGAPLSGQVALDVKGRWKTLARFGPNDGLTLLADEILNSGRVVFEIGQDHYFRDPEIDLKALALACLVLEQLAKTTLNG
jgi:hypothetical protein